MPLVPTWARCQWATPDLERVADLPILACPAIHETTVPR